MAQFDGCGAVRFASRGEADFADQLLSAMRKQFGDHAEIAADASY